MSTTMWEAASAETVERYVTSPIEELATTVKGVRNVRSTSGKGYSSVNIEFEQNTDHEFCPVGVE